MLFVLLFIAIIILLGAILAANAGRNSTSVLAAHENLKRVHPDDALSQLGPNEFEAAYMRASRKRSSTVSMWTSGGAGVGFVLALFPATMLLEDNAFVSVFIMAAGLGLGMQLALRHARSRTPEVFDLMRQDLRL